MCDFNNLDEAAKTLYHLELNKYAEAVGGKGNFLTMLEGIRKNKSSVLISGTCKFRFVGGMISWNKVIYQDKIDLLREQRVGENERGNFLPSSEDKSFKKVLNLVRTLSPIAFEVQSKGEYKAEGFSVHAFDTIDENTVKINAMFDVIFFCAMDTVKKVLNHKPKEA